MILAAGLVCGAALLAWLAPSALNRLVVNGRDPSLALMCWLLMILAVLVTAAAGIVLLLASGRRNGVADWLRPCALFGHRHLHPWDELLGSALLTVLLVAAWRAGASGLRRWNTLRRMHQAHLNLMLTRAVDTRDGVLWLDHHAPFAYSVGGRPGLIVAAQAVRRLPRGAAGAILGHERHHLRRRHHLIMIAVQAVRDAMPRVPLFRQAPDAVGTLTELTADADAARSYGRKAVRRALTTLDDAQADHSLRLRHLSHSAVRPGPRVVMARLAAGLTSTVLPSTLGVVVLFTLVTAACSLH